MRFKYLLIGLFLVTLNLHAAKQKNPPVKTKKHITIRSMMPKGHFMISGVSPCIQELTVQTPLGMKCLVCGEISPNIRRHFAEIHLGGSSYRCSNMTIYHGEIALQNKLVGNELTQEKSAGTGQTSALKRKTELIGQIMTLRAEKTGASKKRQEKIADEIASIEKNLAKLKPLKFLPKGYIKVNSNSIKAWVLRKDKTNYCRDCQEEMGNMLKHVMWRHLGLISFSEKPGKNVVVSYCAKEVVFNKQKDAMILKKRSEGEGPKSKTRRKQILKENLPAQDGGDFDAEQLQVLYRFQRAAIKAQAEARGKHLRDDLSEDDLSENDEGLEDLELSKFIRDDKSLQQRKEITTFNK